MHCNRLGSAFPDSSELDEKGDGMRNDIQQILVFPNK